jgi:hypothetical protein
MDAVLDRPLDEIIKELALPDDVRRALLGEPGPLYDGLLAALAYEQGAWTVLTAAMARVALTESCASDCFRAADTTAGAILSGRKVPMHGHNIARRPILDHGLNISATNLACRRAWATIALSRKPFSAWRLRRRRILFVSEFCGALTGADTRLTDAFRIAKACEAADCLALSSIACKLGYAESEVPNASSPSPPAAFPLRLTFSKEKPPGRISL